jgi:ADP-heptose:LPS heptosyltransferase
MKGIDRVIPDGEAPPQFDVHCPLLSLPLVFGTRVESIPAPNQYLTADRESSGRWAELLAGTKNKKVGIAWAGSAGFANDRNRSLPLASLAPLAGIKGIQLFSIQKGKGAAQASSAPQGMHLIDHTSNLNDFSDTAALMANLDLVISVDTAVAHLAGSMGKPVWLLLPYAADWRWLLDRDDSPWYPTMRLFRQKSPGDWAEVIARLSQILSG